MTTETLHDFDPNAGFDIDQETVETPDRLGPLYPIIQWSYGDQKSAAKGVDDLDGFGGWFFSLETQDDDTDEWKERKEAIAETMRAADWQDTVWVHDSGSSTAGLWKREIALSVISMRKRWEIYSEAGQLQAWAWNDYDTAKAAGRPSSRAHVLVLVKGLEEHGPFVITLKGSAGMAFEGTRKVQGALAEFSRTVIAKANMLSAEAAKKANQPAPKWPLRCFWLPVGADRDAKGKPKFTEVGSGKETSRVIVPIALGLSKDPDLKRFYVGPELKQRTQELYEENEEWRTAWNTMDQAATETKAAEPTRKVEAPDTSEEALASLGL